MVGGSYRCHGELGPAFDHGHHSASINPLTTWLTASVTNTVQFPHPRRNLAAGYGRCGLCCRDERAAYGRMDEAGRAGERRRRRDLPSTPRLAAGPPLSAATSTFKKSASPAEVSVHDTLLCPRWIVNCCGRWLADALIARLAARLELHHYGRNRSTGTR